LLTPQLDYCGVNGVMRGQVLRVASQLGIAVRETRLQPDDLVAADEVFLTNAVRGVRPLVALGARRWNVGAVTLQLHARLQLEQSTDNASCE
jgi:4-amino-4-deoxychorismate lyase